MTSRYSLEFNSFYLNDDWRVLKQCESTDGDIDRRTFKIIYYSIKFYLQKRDQSIYSNKYTYSFARANFVSLMIAHKRVA